MFKSAACICVTFFALTLAATQVQADSITLNNLEIIPVPFSSSFFPAALLGLAINDSSSIAGGVLGSTVNPVPIGFVIPAGAAAVAIQAPSAQMTDVTGINDSGTLAGFSSSFGPNQGFIYSGGNFTPVTVGSGTVLTGINNNGDIIGNQGGSGFLIHAGVTTAINLPGSSTTYTSGVNDSDQVVGSGISGFIRQSNGQYTTLDFLPFGINDAGIIVGDANSVSDPVSIIMIDGTEYTFSIPGASYTDIYGINNNNEVIGAYGEGRNTYIFEGQLPTATPTPEPASDAALGMLLMSSVLLCRHHMNRPV